VPVRHDQHPPLILCLEAGRSESRSLFSVTSTRTADLVTGSRTRLVLICGLPASGKSTLARRLALKIPATRLDKDQWTTELGHDPWDDNFRPLIEGQLWALTLELLAQGQSVILEWGHWARVERDEKRCGARALGVGVELRYLDAPLEELIERAQRRNASGEWTASPMKRAHFEQWATMFQPPDEEELLLSWIHRPTTWLGSESGGRHRERSTGAGLTSSVVIGACGTKSL